VRHLSLAVEIADRVLEAGRAERPIDPDDVADQLVEAHPEAGLGRDEVREALLEEAAAAGLAS
jgi:hypothetical protein